MQRTQEVQRPWGTHLLGLQGMASSSSVAGHSVGGCSQEYGFDPDGWEAIRGDFL